VLAVVSVVADDDFIRRKLKQQTSLLSKPATNTALMTLSVDRMIVLTPRFAIACDYFNEKA
jgi:hypothetical protein